MFLFSITHYSYRHIVIDFFNAFWWTSKYCLCLIKIKAFWSRIASDMVISVFLPHRHCWSFVILFFFFKWFVVFNYNSWQFNPLVNFLRRVLQELKPLLSVRQSIRPSQVNSFSVCELFGFTAPSYILPGDFFCHETSVEINTKHWSHRTTERRKQSCIDMDGRINKQTDRPSNV